MKQGVYNRKGTKRPFSGLNQQGRLIWREKMIISFPMKTIPNTAKVFLVLAGLVLATGARADEPEKTILAMGDSLMAGYNLPPDASFPAQLENWLNNQGAEVRVLNSGVSGDTSSGALSRLEWALASVPGGMPDLLILEFGANDMLRGIDPAITRKNIDAMLEILSGKNIRVLVMGMRAPPNMGPDYEREFNTIFPELAEKYRAELYPFYLEGVAAIPELNLEDGIHPNEEGIGIMVENAGPVILDLLKN